jgi:hypothetical protein
MLAYARVLWWDFTMQKINYTNLNSRQKETYNFQKVSAVLADYGYATIRLNDDWEGADFLAQHIDGENYLKVQLKSRLTFDQKYVGKNIYMCFPYRLEDGAGRVTWYIFDHDKLLGIFLDKGQISKTSTVWLSDQPYSWKAPGEPQRILLEKHALFCETILE